MIRLDEELAYALADRVADGVSMDQLDREQAGIGFTFMVYVEGSTRWFPHRISNHKAQNWPQTRDRVVEILKERKAQEVA